MKASALGRLSKTFGEALSAIGLANLRQSVFYSAPFAIRFEIGCEESVYTTNPRGGHMANPKYVAAALKRALAIYSALPEPPDILRIDTYPGETTDAQTASALRRAGLHFPHERTKELFTDEYGGTELIEVCHSYWNLNAVDLAPEKLLREIILGDIGGRSVFVSSVYLLCSGTRVLYHLYDDRGLDIAAADKETIRPLYQKFKGWILDYDRQAIDKTFAE